MHLCKHKHIHNACHVCHVPLHVMYALTKNWKCCKDDRLSSCWPLSWPPSPHTSVSAQAILILVASYLLKSLLVWIFLLTCSVQLGVLSVGSGYNQSPSRWTWGIVTLNLGDNLDFKKCILLLCNNQNYTAWGSIAFVILFEFKGLFDENL